MVSLWPWGGEDASPASFERTLSQLQEKITKAQLQLDTLNQHSRRRVALWTLYTSFAYILCIVVLALVVGWRNWGAVEYTAVAGSPIVMYLVRTLIQSYYSYRVNSTTSYLDALVLQRSTTIDKLKAATKYNSTQQLLEKYGGVTPSKPKKSKDTDSRARAGSLMSPLNKSQRPNKGRTSLGLPPPTANIKRTESSSAPSTPQLAPAMPVQPPPLQRILPDQPSHQNLPPLPPSQGTSHNPSMVSSMGGLSRPMTATSEFAPNAFPPPAAYYAGGEAQSGATGEKWYDRILDLVMGEDETSPKNRIVLICENCRLVNGQAPPGCRRLEDVGLWRCFGCGSKNGVVDEGVKAVREMESVVRREERKEKERLARMSPAVEEPEITLREESPAFEDMRWKEEAKVRKGKKVFQVAPTIEVERSTDEEDNGAEAGAESDEVVVEHD